MGIFNGLYVKEDRRSKPVEAFRVVAFTDNVGYVCDEECGEKACADINNDNPEADAGLDPVTITTLEWCMGCGKVIE